MIKVLIGLLDGRNLKLDMSEEEYRKFLGGTSQPGSREMLIGKDFGIRVSHIVYVNKLP
jgi:hypothetical protein